MKNVLVCNNCQKENPIFALTCGGCNFYLRAKMPNIDLWFTIAKYFESPVKAAQIIIQSEHKNFTILLLVLASFKLSINILIFSNLLNLFENEYFSLFNFIILGAALIAMTLIITSFIITIANSFWGLKNRFIDNLSIYIFSFLPIILSLVVLTPIQLALFGVYWFTFNPSPLLIKTFSSYVLLCIEGISLIWSCFLLICSTYAQSKNVVYSLIIGIVLFAVIIMATYFGLLLFF